MKKVVITHTYSLKNRGDYILLKGTVDILKKIFGDGIYLYIFSADPAEDSKIMTEYENVEFINQIPFPVYNIRNLNRLAVSMIVGLFEYLALLIYSKSNHTTPLFLIPEEHKKTIQSLIDSDYIIGRSIDQISDIFGFATLLRNLYVIWLVKVLNKRIFLHSQTIYLSNKGLLGQISRVMLKRSLKNVHVSVREMFSFDYLSGIGIAAPFIPAPSYYPVKEFLSLFPKRMNGNYILVIPRTTLSNTTLENKAELYADLIESMITKYRLDVVLMGQANISKSDDDYTLIDKILSMLSPTARKNVVIQDISRMKIKDFCEKIFHSRITISERFISCMLALSMSIPVISIDPYGGKNRGILMAYGMQDFCFSNHTDSKVLLSSVDSIFNKHDYITKKLVEKNEKFFVECVIKTEDWLYNRKDIVA